MESLEDKVAFITGASRGIGKAIALELARAGAHIVSASRTTDANPVILPGTVDQTAREAEALGRRALGVRMDLTKEEEVEQAFQRAFEEFGRIDILVNNAGVSFNGSVAELPVKRWDLVLNINLRGTYLCCKAVMPHMMERRSGRILNISSGASRATGPGRVSYGVSKVGQERLTVGLAAELKDYNIAVNDISLDKAIASEGFVYLNPGVDTSSWEKAEGMGEAAVWVLQQDPSYTGQVVTYTELQNKYGFGRAR